MRILPLLLLLWNGHSSFAWKFRLGRNNWFYLGAPEISDHEPVPEDQWFNQKLNHFDAQDTRIWRQKFNVNDKYYNASKEESLVFLMIGGEGPADPRWMVKGAWIEYARELQALCIMVEHRYYGKSKPLPDLSLENLEYLSSKQALADLAYFIESFNIKYNLNNSKWILFGGSYPGSLAAWMRLKYPHLVYASVSTSGPLKAEVDFQDYYRVVVDALIEKTGNNQCVNLVNLAFHQVKNLMTVNPELVDKTFKLCKPLQEASVLDKKTFINSMADFFAEVVQYNEDNRVFGDGRRKNITINTLCDMLATPGPPAYTNYGHIAQLFVELENATCLDYDYGSVIKTLKQERVSDIMSDRQWFYQTCTEFGFYQTSTGEKQIFGNEFDLQYFIHQCMDVFGNRFTEDFIRDRAKLTNAYYGGTDISATRVLYVHGSVDPWHALGITATKDITSPAIYIKGTAHCANMYPSSANDSSALKNARVTIRRQLKEWAGMS